MFTCCSITKENTNYAWGCLPHISICWKLPASEELLMWSTEMVIFGHKIRRKGLSVTSQAQHHSQKSSWEFWGLAISSYLDPLISNRHWHKSHFLATETWHWFLVHQNTRLGATVWQMLLLLTTRRSDVYHLLPTCHVYTEVRLQFLVARVFVTFHF